MGWLLDRHMREKVAVTDGGLAYAGVASSTVAAREEVEEEEGGHLPADMAPHSELWTYAAVS
jgi:hypothetical protein